MTKESEARQWKKDKGKGTKETECQGQWLVFCFLLFCVFVFRFVSFCSVFFFVFVFFSFSYCLAEGGLRVLPLSPPFGAGRQTGKG